jgi:hypothetical protein
MAKTAATPVFPTVDVNAFASMQKANVETLLQAQRIVSETAQAVAKLQADWLKEVAQQMQAYFGAAAAKKPEAMLADGRASTERALAVARQGFDLGVRAQSEVVDLFTKRAVANLGEVKSFAAAA